MKIKCVECKNEFAVRKEVMEKRIAKGITEENYLCRACRPKAMSTTNGYTLTCTRCSKVLKVNKNRLDKVKAEGRFETYECRECKPKVEKKKKSTEKAKKKATKKSAAKKNNEVKQAA